MSRLSTYRSSTRRCWRRRRARLRARLQLLRDQIVARKRDEEEVRRRRAAARVGRQSARSAAGGRKKKGKNRPRAWPRPVRMNQKSLRLHVLAGFPSGVTSFSSSTPGLEIVPSAITSDGAFCLTGGRERLATSSHAALRSAAFTTGRASAFSASAGVVQGTTSVMPSRMSASASGREQLPTICQSVDLRCCGCGRTGAFEVVVPRIRTTFVSFTPGGCSGFGALSRV